MLGLGIDGGRFAARFYASGRDSTLQVDRLTTRLADLVLARHGATHHREGPDFPRLLKLLESGKNAVTANKALLSNEGQALTGLATNHSCGLCFEAAVGSGTPIIGPIANALSAVAGIQAIEAHHGCVYVFLTGIVEIDTVSRIARVQPGVRNLAISRIVSETLESLGMEFPAPSVDIDEIKEKYHAIVEREAEQSGEKEFNKVKKDKNGKKRKKGKGNAEWLTLLEPAR